MLLARHCSAQEPARRPDSLHVKRLTAVVVTEGTLYLSSLAGLYYAWYRDYPQSSFHLFNDTREWMQVDKCGHGISAYYISRIGYSGYRWSGLSENRSAWLGGLLGFAYLLNIEILDGFSAGWGFSVGDLTANTLGCLAFTGQQLAWHEQRIVLKYSFHPTGYAGYRSDLLGKNLIQEMVKDYNGHSYWLSANIASFLPRGAKFPKWLNVAFGYGAEGMTGAMENPASVNGTALPAFTRYRQFYLSLDADLTRIPVHSKLIKGIFTVIGFIKLPAPALEYNSRGQFRFHPFYF
ncbi:MAG TPA: DUF2279 domain-containing protein [Bacteroidales bacterium]|nr:DUF2279 domain-containing protein [Bacteroidales bacterium]